MNRSSGGFSSCEPPDDPSVDRASANQQQRGKAALKRLLIIGALAAASAFTFNISANAAGQCVPNPEGTVCAQGDPTTQTGGIWADGNGANGGPSGYIGVNDNEGVVGCWTGDYNGSTDNVILDPSNPPSSPPDPTAP